MSKTLIATPRQLWRNVHLWLGIGLGLLLVPVAVTGGLLAAQDVLAPFLYTARYAVTSGPQQPLAAYTAAASTALSGQGQSAGQITTIRLPERAGDPVTVLARGASQPGARPGLMAVYLDPPTARVLDTSDYNTSFFRILHRFHENLTVPEYSGRSVVGWVGVAMFLLSLTGIYLWWPRNGAILRALRWQRGPGMFSNLHHMTGFWIALPLAAVSLTGIYLGFPQQGRELLSTVAPVSPRQGGAPLRNPALTADQAVAAAATGPATPVAVFWPAQQSHAWRVVLRTDGGETTAMVDDRSGRLSEAQPTNGDRIAGWIRWIHEGSHAGPVWQAIVFLCGLAPLVLGLTGPVIWWRQRQRKRMLDIDRRMAGTPSAAE